MSVWVFWGIVLTAGFIAIGLYRWSADRATRRIAIIAAPITLAILLALHTTIPPLPSSIDVETITNAALLLFGLGLIYMIAFLISVVVWLGAAWFVHGPSERWPDPMEPYRQPPPRPAAAVTTAEASAAASAERAAYPTRSP